MMMKHLCLLVFALIANATVYAQTVPNGGFENWTLQVVYEDPDNWITLNMLGAFGAPATTIQSSDAHSGNYAALLETAEIDLGGDGTLDTLPGTITLGLFDPNGESTSGASVTGTPDTLAGWFKFLPQGDEGFGVGVTLSRWNTTTQMREIVGFGDFMNTSAINQYTRIAIPVTYYTEDAPDTVEIQITNAIGVATPGTQLYIDDLSLEETSTASIADPEFLSLSCFPNPADESITIIGQQNDQLMILNVLGEKTGEIEIKAGTPLQLNTSDYQNGIYLLQSTSGQCYRLVIQH